MAFTYRIESANEIHRDPGGHYHHWTILSGDLLDGTMLRGEYMLIPANDGRVMVARMLDFFRRPFKIQGAEVSADSDDRHLAVVTWHPVPREEQILSDSIATLCPRETYDRVVLETLERDPVSYLHCTDCMPDIHDIPEARLIIQRLQTHPDPRVARMAKFWTDYWQRQNPDR